MNGNEAVPCVECGDQTIAARPICNLCQADKVMFIPMQQVNDTNNPKEELEK